MGKFYTLLAALLVTTAIFAVPAYAQDQSGEIPEDTIGSMVLTLDDLENNLQQLVSPFEGIVVFSILPKGWDVGEQGIDKDTGELATNVNRYVLVSRSPVVDENEAPDFTFELSIFKHGLFDDMPAGLSDQEHKDYEAQAFRAFLDVQISDALNAGLHCTSKPADIKPIPYGTGTRPYTLLVPIFYETQGGAQIYTFTSAYNGKVWMLNFLIMEGQVENYGGLMALVLNNSFALTFEEFDEYNRQMAAEAAAAGNE